MLSSYLKTNQLSQRIAVELVKNRNNYNYPNVRLVRSRNLTGIRISAGLWATPDESKADQPTDINLDNYHRSLLTSDDPSENLLGTASIVFWGFFTFKRNYALNRLKWHIEGHGSKPPTSPEIAHEQLKKIKEEPDHGRALGHLSQISQLGSIPFASKAITFLRPEATGIYDGQINKGLITEEWYPASGLRTRLGPVTNKEVQQGYTRWCSFLQAMSSHMNAGIEHGERWHWTDPSGIQSNWRSVDVERAMFNLFKAQKR